MTCDVQMSETNVAEAEVVEAGLVAVADLADAMGVDQLVDNAIFANDQVTFGVSVSYSTPVCAEKRQLSNNMPLSTNLEMS